MVRKALTGVSFPSPRSSRGEGWVRAVSTGELAESPPHRNSLSRISTSPRKRGEWSQPVALHLHAHYRAMSLDRGPAGDEVAAVHAPPVHRRFASLHPRLAPGLGKAGAGAGARLARSVGMWSVVWCCRWCSLNSGRRGAPSRWPSRSSCSASVSRRRHGADHRSFRHRGGDLAQHRLPWRRLCCRGLSTTLWQFILVHFLIGLGPRDLRAADDGGLATGSIAIAGWR